jgi:hypothetical protein
MGRRNSIHDLQNYVVGLGKDGLVLQSDGSLDEDRSFVRLDYLIAEEANVEITCRLTSQPNRLISLRPGFRARQLQPR